MRLYGGSRNINDRYVNTYANFYDEINHWTGFDVGWWTVLLSLDGRVLNRLKDITHQISLRCHHVGKIQCVRQIFINNIIWIYQWTAIFPRGCICKIIFTMITVIVQGLLFNKMNPPFSGDSHTGSIFHKICTIFTGLFFVFIPPILMGPYGPCILICHGYFTGNRVIWSNPEGYG